MKFIWHEPKRQSNLKKHGIDFAESEKIFIISMREANKNEQLLFFRNL